MPELDHDYRSNNSPQLQRFAASALLLAVSLSTACKKVSSPTTPVIATASPVVSNKPAERTPDEAALIDAAIKGDTVAGKALLDRGVNANTKDPEGRTPLTEAAYYGHTEFVKLLLDHGADVFAKKVNGETVYDTAAAHPDIGQMIKRETDLLEACGRGDIKGAKELIERGAHPNVRDPDGRTPLTEAVWNSNADLVRLLLDRGANPNSRKNDGATPLSIARGKGSRDIIELLQKAGAK